MKIENNSIIQVLLNNIPTNAGELATYVFTIPPISDNIPEANEFNIHFPASEKAYIPKTFSYSLGSNIKCGLYVTNSFDSSFINYKSLLEIMESP
jgi:hypothetical protein